MKTKVLFFLAIMLGICSCSSKIKSMTLTDANAVSEIAEVKSKFKQSCKCTDPNAYAPDDRYPEYQDTKYISVNFHYPNDSKKQYNYIGEEAVSFSKSLLKYCNDRLEKNGKMILPEGNDIPVYDAGFRYRLAEDDSTPSGWAVYEDVDDEHWYYIKKGKNKTNYSRAIINNHGVNEDSQLNFFAMVYPPDSLKNPDFKSGVAGIALGTSLKIAGIKEVAQGKPWVMASVTNHEVGHVYGLRHSWYKNDGCDDTPPHANCWASTEEGKCAGPVSNNLMDYNSQQLAITPCQIGVVMSSMHDIKDKGRGLLIKDWCQYDPTKTLVVTEDLELNRSVDMKGDIIVQEGVSLRISCRVHMPSGAKIIVHPGATLILNGADIHNDCGQQWEGIEILSRKDKTGKIEYYGVVDIKDLKDSPTADSE